MTKLDHLRQSAGRLAAIEERQKTEINHAIIERYDLQTELLAAMPGLLRACDAYIELLIAYRELDASRFGMTIDRSEVEKNARAKLEETLG